MKNILDYKNVDFRNNKILQRNRLLTRPFYCSYKSTGESIRANKTESGRYKLLNGKWKFFYQKTPFTYSYDIGICEMPKSA